MQLSDTQLLILSSASQRTDHAAVLPAIGPFRRANRLLRSNGESP